MASSRSVAVLDPSVVIDLEHGSVLREALGLPFVFSIPDLAVEELGTEVGKILRRDGVRVTSFDSSMVQQLYALARKERKLSLEDLACFLSASLEGGILLAGDGPLRAFSQAKGVRVHGVLWVLDELVKRRTLTAPRAARSLGKMLTRNARLPRVECDSRLKKWSRRRKGS